MPEEIRQKIAGDGENSVKRAASEASILMWEQLKELGHSCKPVKEWSFCDDRRWRFDFALLPVSPAVISRYKIGIEIEGGVFTQGRHTRGAGFVKDLEKYNFATLLGWRILRFTPTHVLKGEAIAFIRRVLAS